MSLSVDFFAHPDLEASLFIQHKRKYLIPQTVILCVLKAAGLDRQLLEREDIFLCPEFHLATLTRQLCCNRENAEKEMNLRWLSNVVRG